MQVGEGSFGVWTKEEGRATGRMQDGVGGEAVALGRGPSDKLGSGGAEGAWQIRLVSRPCRRPEGLWQGSPLR